MAIQLLPTHDNVLIVRDPMADKVGSIHLPMNRKTVDEKRRADAVKGTVAFTGPEVEDLKRGDRVVYRWFTGHEYIINGERCVFLPRDQILARIVA